MTKRSIENGIEQLSDELLRGLNDRQRLALALTSVQRDKTGWLEQLTDTVPTAQYTGPELSYFKRARMVSYLGRRATYDLHTAVLGLQLEQKRAVHERTFRYLTHSEAGPPDSEEIESDPVWEYGRLYRFYHAYRRFAEQVVGVNLSEMLSPHPDGPVVAKAATDSLDGLDFHREQAVEELPNLPEDFFPTSEKYVPSTIPDDRLDRWALAEYVGLVEIFEEQLPEPTQRFGSIYS